MNRSLVVRSDSIFICIGRPTKIKDEEETNHADNSAGAAMELDQPVIGRTRKNPFLPQVASGSIGINSIELLSKVKQSLQQQERQTNNNTNSAQNNRNFEDSSDDSSESDGPELEHESSDSDEESIDEEEEQAEENMDLETDPKKQQVRL